MAAVGCYAAWGVLPLLFMALAAQGFTALEIVAHRAVWSLGWAALLGLLASQSRQVWAVLRNPRTMAWLALSTLLIAGNWGVYVWATTHQATLEASLGYYINPLLNMSAGAVLFRERMGRWGKVAIALAAVGVLIQSVALGRPPWISLILAFSFCTYGVIRKRVPVDAQAGLFIECLLLMGPGLAYVGWLEAAGQGHAFGSLPAFAWAMATGPATVVPLALFAWSARRLPLSTLGFIQFLAPTLQFAVGVAAGEAFTPLRAASFLFIWLGAAVFAWAAWSRARDLRPGYSAA
jgi:chloramphenicol-sensitive protein RarD